MIEERSFWSVTWSVWRALFIREAMYRLYHRRAAWAWLLFEPVAHIGFVMFIFTMIRMRVIGGIDTALWVMVGLLGYFMFRRTMSIGMGAVAMAKPLFAYRQVSPADTVIMRAVTEGLLMLVISIVLLLAAALLDVPVWPDDPMMVLRALFALWLFGFGVGMVLSVPRELVRETEDLVNLVMTPVYFLSGVLIPVASVPQPYREWLMLNPIAHGLDALRLGFANHYQPFDGLSLSYIYMMALVCIFMGLVLHRIFRTRLIQQ